MSDPADDMFVKHKDFWMVVREALLSMVNIIEIKLGNFPTTSEIRRSYKDMIAKQVLKSYDK